MLRFLTILRISLFSLMAITTAALAQSTNAASTNPVDINPSEIVAQLETALISSSKLSSFDDRLELVQPVVEMTHDFASIARLVTGRHWRKLTGSERVQFIELFTELSAISYADRFKALGNSEFNYVETTEQPRNSQKVISNLSLDINTNFAELSNKRELSFEYILRPIATADTSNKGGWKIINIIVDGVSDLALKRANYVTLINEKGFAALLDELNEDIAEVREKS